VNPGRRDLSDLTRAFLQSRRSPEIQPFLAQWPISSERRSTSPVLLPVVRWLAGLEGNDPAGGDPAGTRELLSEIKHAAASLTWRQSYGARQVCAHFLENYGWAEIVGLTGELASERVACGFLLLGPQTHYPPHQHEAEEIYVPLSGMAEWQKGEAGWLERSVGSIIHHARHEQHSMRTASTPLLALYLWRSENLAQQSRLATRNSPGVADDRSGRGGCCP